MKVTRKDFLKTSAVFAAAFGLDPASFAETNAGGAFKPEDYAPLRAELARFYPAGFCRGKCQSEAVLSSFRAILADLDAWAKENPGYDALDARCAYYRILQKHFQPVLFAESPFYFEAGVNGGWSGHNGGGIEANPSKRPKQICMHLAKGPGRIPDAAFRLMRDRNHENLLLCCGMFVDEMHNIPPFRTILRKGFGGVRAEVAAALEKCPKEDASGRKQLECALLGLDTIHELQLKFAEAAQARLRSCEAAGSRSLEVARLKRIVESASRCPWEPPRTFYEGLNTLWFAREILGLVEGLSNCSVGRPDAMLIGLYEADLAAGRLTREEARDLVARFLVIGDCHDNGTDVIDSYADGEPDLPLTLGGCDAEGNPLDNELTEMFLDAHIGCDCLRPKLHCRISRNSPKRYLRKIGEMLMRGHAVFTLFNDDRFVPQFLADGLSPEDARAYIGSGCWDGVVESVLEADTCNYVSFVKLLELMIYRDAEKEKRLRLRFRPLESAATFEEVREAVTDNLICFLRDAMGEYTRWGRFNALVNPHPVYTALLPGGIKSRRDLKDGALPVNAQPRIVTLGFVGNVADSLLAIRKVCFEDKACTLAEFLDVVRSNWAGEKGERIRKLVLAAPYWGDNSAASNGIMGGLIRDIHKGTRGMVTDQDGEYFFGIYTYREFLYWGKNTRATPDGRRSGEQLVQGLSPSELRCEAGATDVLNAVGALPHDLFYESNLNQTFERDAMNVDTWEAVLRVFSKKGAHLLQPNCNSVEELLDAQKHPERHRNLMVRVCGFSARFVNLSKSWQDEVIARNRLK